MTTEPQPISSILKISPYVGGDVVPTGFTRRVALSSNESRLGPSPKAKEAMKKAIEGVEDYPNGDAKSVREAVCERYGLEYSRTLCGNGSEEILHMLTRCYARAGDEVVFNQYGFLVYKIAALASGATPVPVPQHDLSINVDNILEHVTEKTKIVFLDNPGNPTGGYLPYDELKRLHANLPKNVLLVLDGAYKEYMDGVDDYNAGFDLAKDAPNIIVTGTFSKAHGLAGLRIGWCYASEHVCDILNRVRPPFNVNRIAQAAATASMKDRDWIEHVCEHTRTQREWFIGELKDMGLQPMPACSNFVLVRFPEHDERSPENAYRYLGQNGVMVRPVAGYGLTEYLRISIGLEEEMKETAEQLRTFLAR